MFSWLCIFQNTQVQYWVEYKIYAEWLCDRIIFYGLAKSDYWNLIFHQQVLQVGLIDRPGQGLQTSVYVPIFEIFMEIIGGCWFSYFNSRTMLTRTIHTIVLFESTSGEVTRIRYPVTRITYLENFLCQTNKLSVLLKSFLPCTLSCRRQCGSLYSN